MIAVRAALAAARASLAALGHALDALEREFDRDGDGDELAATPPADVLDVQGACELLRVSRAQLHRLVKSGRVRERRLGDSPRYVRGELLEDLRR